MIAWNDVVIILCLEMGQKNCKLKPELVQELVHKTYCESTICSYFVRVFMTNSRRQTGSQLTEEYVLHVQISQGINWSALNVLY